MKEEQKIREEIAVRILRETLIPSAQIARWTGLSRERVHALLSEPSGWRAAGRSNRHAGGFHPPACLFYVSASAWP